jgi:glycosyltransferase involved in cell wall biosynthesis
LRTIYHLRSGHLSGLARQGGWAWRLIKIAISLADLVIALDVPTLEMIRHNLPQQSVVRLPNFVDCDEIERKSAPVKASDRKPDLPRLTFIGWVVPAKGVRELVEAAVGLLESLPFELELIGPSDPAYLDSVRAVGAPLESRLLVRGELPHREAMRALRQSDALVLPSYSEAFPNVVIEAMALGKPVIGTNVGAIREMIGDGQNGKCGFVVPPGNVAALKEAIAQLLIDPQGRATLGENARARCRARYDSSVAFEALKEIWISYSEGRGA